MKKLIISEMVSIILVLGIFLLVFTFLNGWEKVGKERYGVSGVAAFTAAGIAIVVGIAVAVGAGVAVDAVGAAVVVGSVAVVAAGVGVAVGVVGAAAAAVVVAVVAGVVGVAVGVAETSKINVPKKVIWFSLGAEAMVIILPILLINFC